MYKKGSMLSMVLSNHHDSKPLFPGLSAQDAPNYFKNGLGAKGRTSPCSKYIEHAVVSETNS